MKKIILSLIAVMATMSINAQVVKVYENDVLTKTYTNTESNQVKVVFEEAPDPNLLPGKFTIGEGKQVQFTRSNLYWDGSAFKFEANQTDFDQGTYDGEFYIYNPNHVSHFYWTKTAAASYAALYDDGECAITDKFFADGSDADHKLTVEGTSDLYVLSSAQWTYIIENRTNASSLCKYAVTVTNGGTSYKNCLIIAPDDYDFTTTPLASNYTLEEVNAAGFVCLPAAGYRAGFKDGSKETIYIDWDMNFGEVWSSTPHVSDTKRAYNLRFQPDSTYPENRLIPANDNTDNRTYGISIRLVK